MPRDVKDVLREIRGGKQGSSQKEHEEQRQRDHSNPPKPQKVRVINKYDREY
jgi:hypothetical protein